MFVNRDAYRSCVGHCRDKRKKWQRCDHFGWRISSNGVHVCLLYMIHGTYIHIHINATGLYLKIIILFSRRDKQKTGRDRRLSTSLLPRTLCDDNKYTRQTDFPVDYYYYFQIKFVADIQPERHVLSASNG
jgi:hypothetical protein